STARREIVDFVIVVPWRRSFRPQPEEGARTGLFLITGSIESARLEGEGAAPPWASWFETRRSDSEARITTLLGCGAPHHEEPRDSLFPIPYSLFPIRYSLFAAPPVTPQTAWHSAS